MLFGVLKSGDPRNWRFFTAEKNVFSVPRKCLFYLVFLSWGTFWPPWRQCLFFNLAEFFCIWRRHNWKTSDPFWAGKEKKNMVAKHMAATTVMTIHTFGPTKWRIIYIHTQVLFLYEKARTFVPKCSKESSRLSWVVVTFLRSITRCLWVLCFYHKVVDFLKIIIDPGLLRSRDIRKHQTEKFSRFC